MATSVTVAPPQICRCSPPGCVRPLGHEGECRPTWTARQVCGAWMPNVREHCVRTAGHGSAHRSAYAMENARRAFSMRYVPKVRR